MTCALPHAVRAAVESDLPLIVHSWVQEMRHASTARGIPDQVYFPEQRRLVLGLLQRAAVVVAHNPDDEHHVYGVACVEGGGPTPVLHWLYVKSVYRQVGLGGALLDHALGPVAERAAAAVTQLTKLFTHRAEHGGRPDLLARWKLVPNPYLLTRAVPQAA